MHWLQTNQPIQNLTILVIRVIQISNTIIHCNNKTTSYLIIILSTIGWSGPGSNIKIFKLRISKLHVTVICSSGQSADSHATN